MEKIDKMWGKNVSIKDGLGKFIKKLKIAQNFREMDRGGPKGERGVGEGPRALGNPGLPNPTPRPSFGLGGGLVAS